METGHGWMRLTVVKEPKTAAHPRGQRGPPFESSGRAHCRRHRRSRRCPGRRPGGRAGGARGRRGARSASVERRARRRAADRTNGGAVVSAGGTAGRRRTMPPHLHKPHASHFGFLPPIPKRSKLSTKSSKKKFVRRR